MSVFTDALPIRPQLPDSLSCLTQLEVCRLESNKLTGPINIQLPRCRVLRLGSNHLSGSLPPSLFSKMTSLEVLALEQNDLSGALDGLGFRSLTRLRCVSSM